MTKIKVTNRKPSASPEVDPSGNGLNAGRATYRPFAKPRGSDDYVDSQFQRPPIRIPKKSICLAAFLFIVGSCLLIFGFLSLFKELSPDTYIDRILPMIVIGFLMFIPGFYHVRIAYYAFIGVAGFNFDDIPEFE